MQDLQDQKAVLDFWFGHVEETLAPSPNRARLWFAEDPQKDRELTERFLPLVEQASKGELDHWLTSARGELALIIILDQFRRHVYRDCDKAYAEDAKALMIAMQGAIAEKEHKLSLIERVFYYFPLLHAEDLFVQEQSLHAYRLLESYALEETKVIYKSFVQFAKYHRDVIAQFGRFPGRNRALGRESSEAEKVYLNELMAQSKN